VAPSGSQAPLVLIPTKAQDQPSWARVGVIALAGFLIGIAWPRVVGVRLGPSLPEGTAASAVAMASVPEQALQPAPLQQVAAGPGSPSTAPSVALAAPAAAPSVSVGQPSASPSADRVRMAQVKWEVALVRDAPKTGKVVARLPRGTTVHVGPVSDGWFPVKYGDDFANDGWVYRGAIGR
jgi:hypothetical protein